MGKKKNQPYRKEELGTFIYSFMSEIYRKKGQDPNFSNFLKYKYKRMSDFPTAVAIMLIHHVKFFLSVIGFITITQQIVH